MIAERLSGSTPSSKEGVVGIGGSNALGSGGHVIGIGGGEPAGVDEAVNGRHVVRLESVEKGLSNLEAGFARRKRAVRRQIVKGNCHLWRGKSRLVGGYRKGQQSDCGEEGKTHRPSLGRPCRGGYGISSGIYRNGWLGSA